MGVPANAPSSFAAGTHDGEEVMLAECFLRLPDQRFRRLFLITSTTLRAQPRRAKNWNRAGETWPCAVEINGKSKFAPGELHC